jgi:Flp pilus assembly pilin Flp
MEFEHLLILIKLFAAHLIGDFVIQTDKWVKHKEDFKIKSKYLYFHALLHGILAYLFIAEFSQPLLPILLTIIHFAIDAIKMYLKKSFTIFAIDQVVHFLSIIILWLIFYENLDKLSTISSGIISSEKFWIIGTAYLIAFWPVSILIHQFTLKWQRHLGENGDSSLPNAGKWIGRLERILILTFILIQQFEAIGFLLAAKSVFRFGDLKDESDRKRTEYILVGTLISFTITIGIGLLVGFLLK